MGTIALTSADRNTVSGVVIYKWAALGNADDGAPVAIGYAADITAQVIGTFGGATVVLEGSNDGTNWATLTAKGGTTGISLTSAGLRGTNEVPAFIRPKTSGGTGTSVDAIVSIRALFTKSPY